MMTSAATAVTAATMLGHENVINISCWGDIGATFGTGCVDELRLRGRQQPLEIRLPTILAMEQLPTISTIKQLPT